MTSVGYPGQSWHTIRDVTEGFGPQWPWASLQDFSVDPALPLLLLFNPLGCGGHRGGGNPLPSPQTLLLGDPTVEGAVEPPEASQSQKGQALPHSVALRPHLFPTPHLPGG